jgi:hypothetical protein
VLKVCDECQRVGNIGKRNEMHMNYFLPLNLFMFGDLTLWDHLLGIALHKTKNSRPLNQDQACEGEVTVLRTSLIELAEEFADDEVDVVTSRFSQLTSVSCEKMHYPPLAPMI